MYAEARSCYKNMACYEMKDLVQFSLASKSCHRIFCDTIHSFQMDENIGKVDTDGEENVVRFHHFDEIFQGMTPHDIARDYDELICHREDGVCMCHNSHINIEKDWFGKNKLEVWGDDEFLVVS